MKNRRLLGARVAVRVAGCPTRDGVLISGVKKKTKFIQKFHVRFPNGDVRTYRGDQLLLRGTQAPLGEYIRVGDIVFTKKTLGVVRFIGLHEDYKGPVMVMEPVDPKLPQDTVQSYRKLFPSANLSDDRTYITITRVEEILKLLPPDSLLQQISKIKDKYLALVENQKERDRMFEEERDGKRSRLQELETEQENARKPKPEESNTDENILVPEPKIVSYKFQPGRLGIEAKWDVGEVVSVTGDGQAKNLGIQEKWKIVQIDGEPYTEEKLDAKTDGHSEYTLTFEIPPPEPKTPVNEIDQEPSKPEEPPKLPSPAYEVGLSPIEKERYESKVQQLNGEIKDWQNKVEELRAKNEELEQKHKEMTNLRVKVEHLRNSRNLFINQIKQIKKEEKEYKELAEEYERKRGKLVEKAGISGAEAKGRKVPGPVRTGPAPPNPRNRKKLVTERRRKSARMPKPDAGNTISLT